MEDKKRKTKTLAEGRKAGSGRPKGTTGIKHKREIPPFVVERLTIDNNEYYGKQIKVFREYYGYTIQGFAEVAGLDYTNLSHLENGTAGYKSISALSNTLVKYLKALGVKEVTFKL